jgi:putative ABC transport system permease protein
MSPLLILRVAMQAFRKLVLTLRVAMRALRKNKLRAGLTVLGVVIGIAAVTAMVSIGQSAGSVVQGELQNLGTNVILVFSASRRGGGVHHGMGSTPTLTAKDAEAIAVECKSVAVASAVVGAGGQVIYGNTNWSPREMTGVGEDYLTVRNWQIRHGGFFTDREVQSAAQVCVVGRTIVEKLFQTTNPLGKAIRIRNIPFVIIGVLEPKGANMVGQDQDNVILAPYTTIRKRLQGSNFSNVDVIMVSARSPQVMADAEDEIRQLLYERHHVKPGDPPDFEVQNTTEIAKVLDVVTGTMTALLASIAGISLLVGGVGIMNIMLVSVTERTREIGIRMAVGARSWDILCQFLVEAVLLSSLGGVVGILLGVGASAGATTVINAVTSGSPWPVVISMKAALIALAFSATVGVTFGFFPAMRAAMLDPIEALRYE